MRFVTGGGRTRRYHPCMCRGGALVVLALCCGCGGGVASNAESAPTCNGAPIAWQDAGPLTCTRSIDAYCFYPEANCPPSSWSDVLASLHESCWPGLAGECGRYDVVLAGYLCGTPGVSSVFFYYDKTTGQLVGGLAQAAPDADSAQACLGGPPTLDSIGSCTGTWTGCGDDGGLRTFSALDAAE